MNVSGVCSVWQVVTELADVREHTAIHRSVKDCATKYKLSTYRKHVPLNKKKITLY